MNLEDLINKIIPPNDYQYRNGFSNTYIIDQLSSHERKIVEDELINKLLNQSEDTLIVETLGYLKSKKALPLLYDLLSKSTNETVKLIIATSIFEINEDNEMINVAINSVTKIDNIKDAYHTYRLIPTFYYLGKFKNDRTKQLIKEYTSHPEYLIAYNAKQVLRE